MPARSIERIFVTSDFRRSFRRLPGNIQELFARKEVWFKADAFDSRLRTHRLHGKLKGFWAYSISHQYRVLFRFVNARTVAYLDVGTHEVYR